MEIDAPLAKKIGSGVLLGWAFFLVTLWLISVIGEAAFAIVVIGFAVAVMIGVQPGKQPTAWALVTTLAALVLGLVGLFAYLNQQGWLA